MRLLCSVVMMFLAAAIPGTAGDRITINPEKCEIVLPAQNNILQSLAASELQKHLKIITGANIKIVAQEKYVSAPEKYPFFVGIPVPGCNNPLNREEARWSITHEAAYLYGNDSLLKNNPAAWSAKTSRTGTLFAVYCFLEDELGIHWVEPGDKGIVFNKQNPLTLRTGNFSWTPTLLQRVIRPGLDSRYSQSQSDSSIPENFRQTAEEYKNRENDVQVWLKRMRMGRSIIMNYGHAFTEWWGKYGKTHPEYFALNEKGKREPLNPNKPDRVKMCVSNPELPSAVAREWQKKLKEPYGKIFYETISTCENDSGGYCTCTNCQKLDVPVSGESARSMTDRYIFFTNAILKEAKKTDPKVKAVMYAYSSYVMPPSRENVSPDVIIGFVPTMLNSIAEVNQFYQAWHDKGAKEIFLRPNDHHCNTGLPMGFEKQMFDHFQLGIKNGIIGTDYDSMHGFWPVTGITDYILAKAHVHPEKTFEYWEDEYCSAYGPAKNDIKQYFAYWRNNLWDKRIMPDCKNILEKGKYGNFRRGLMRELGKYYQASDFDKTDAILTEALSRQISREEKQRVEELILANKHARLTFEAITATGKKKLIAAKKLLDFRIEHKNQLSVDWTRLMGIEKQFGDITGVSAAATFVDFSAFCETPLMWYFKTDPANTGLKDNWQAMQVTGGISTSWSLVQTDTNWKAITSDKTPANLRESLKNYEGIGWYATAVKVDKTWKDRQILLYFGAVDKSCWIYVNGKLAGEHICRNDTDWRTPFTIKIDQEIDWKQKEQNIVIRVESGSMGGIWKPVWLVSKGN